MTNLRKANDLTIEFCDLGNDMLERGENDDDVLIAFIGAAGALVKSMRERGVMDETLMDRIIKEFSIFGLSQ